MTTVIFVHGTGGRKNSYAVTFRDIEDKLYQLKPGINLAPCLWGDTYGTKLNAGGLSVPDYDSTGGSANSNNQEDEHILLWENLYKDPLYEINLVSIRPIRGQATVPGRRTPSQELRDRVQQLITSSQLDTQLTKAGIAQVFNQAYTEITRSKPYNRLLETASRPLDADYGAIARAIVAASINLCEREWIDTPIRFYPGLRDETVDFITRELTQNTQSRGVIGDWVNNVLLNIGKSKFNNKLQRERGALTDATYPFSGDILLYQAKGEEIRDFIKEQVENVEPPVVLLAHSLGGIACVDLLVEHHLPQVKLLITVGSQASFLYEIGALHSLSYGEPLKNFTNKWLNIYDLRDILSYVCEGVFPKTEHEICDVKVNNQQPFPESHGAYWYNSETWDAILKALP